MKTAYPRAADLQQLLADGGFAQATIAALDLATAVETGRTAFEGRVQRVMLAPTEPTTRRFNPPTTTATLVLRADLVTLTSVAYQPAGAVAETLVQDDDFTLEPFDAPDRGKPYSMLLFPRRRWRDPLPLAQRGSLHITGRWGYGTGIPEDAWTAMLNRAAWTVWPQLTQRTTRGMLGFKDGDTSVDYGVETWNRLRDGWNEIYEAGVRHYRRLGL